MYSRISGVGITPFNSNQFIKRTDVYYNEFDSGYFDADSNTQYVIDHEFDSEPFQIFTNLFFKVTASSPNVYTQGDIIQLNSGGYPLGSTADTSYGVQQFVKYDQDPLNAFTILTQDRVLYTYDYVSDSGVSLSFSEGQLRVVSTVFKFI